MYRLCCLFIRNDIETTETQGSESPLDRPTTSWAVYNGGEVRVGWGPHRGAPEYGYGSLGARAMPLSGEGRGMKQWEEEWGGQWGRSGSGNKVLCGTSRVDVDSQEYHSTRAAVRSILEKRGSDGDQGGSEAD